MYLLTCCSQGRLPCITPRATDPPRRLVCDPPQHPIRVLQIRLAADNSLSFGPSPTIHHSSAQECPAPAHLSSDPNEPHRTRKTPLQAQTPAHSHHEWIPPVAQPRPTGHSAPSTAPQPSRSAHSGHTASRNASPIPRASRIGALLLSIR
jgi:hypothetical protein